MAGARTAVVAVAADCAQRSGARGALAELGAVANRGGSSLVARQSRGPRDTLSGE
ncbi:hypothetical protein [Wenjunlia tyrosinilytica]|uniref:Uncharacterized protein n=1 Tax=Wenjunlia tyrosinilytica TaxID=1544741 RepID=A0A917ZHU1_9ACTN|nr:hypothetical protein [Wenjunlia tyrosinilytica]GGO82082.1 hypothetical protein GCM10012280_07820 [Wenjunlia tyrosinilytica]